MPHAWALPAVIAWNSMLPCTADGWRRSDVVPSPSCPAELSPQHIALRLSTSPQVKFHPTSKLRKRCPPITGTGDDRSVTPPSPSWPCASEPQHHAAPSVSTPQVCAAPAAIERNACPAADRTGAPRELRLRSPS